MVEMLYSLCVPLSFAFVLCVVGSLSVKIQYLKEWLRRNRKVMVATILIGFNSLNLCDLPCRTNTT